MEFLALYGWSFLGAYLWFFNVEVAVIVAAHKQIAHPFIIGTIAAFGQCSCYLVGFIFSHQLTMRIAYLQKKADKYDLTKYKNSAIGVIFFTSVFGIPPFSAISISAGLLRYPLLRFISVSVLGRIGRFTILAYFPEIFHHWGLWQTSG